MSRFFQYYGQFQSVKGGVGGMPAWGRLLLLVAAIPGIALIALSILALGVSILALLLLTVPAYKVVRALGGEKRETVEGVIIEPAEPARSTTSYAPGVLVGEVMDDSERVPASPGRRPIDVTIVE